jgi:hypothetical protein
MSPVSRILIQIEDYGLIISHEVWSVMYYRFVGATFIP